MTAVDGKSVMMLQALIARLSPDARFTLALAGDAIARLHRQRANQVALAVAATRCYVAVTHLAPVAALTREALVTPALTRHLVALVTLGPVLITLAG